MRARHRLSKLLLRQGIVYSGGQAWTGAHDAWLRRQRFDAPALQMTFESDYDAVLTVKARRDRLDAAIAAMAADSEFTPLVRRLGCLRGIGTLTGFALAVEIGDWHRFTGNTIGSFVGLVPSEYSSGPVTGPGLDHQDRQHPRAPAAGRGRLAPPRPLRGRQDHARPLGARPTSRTGPRRCRATGDCTPAGTPSAHAASGTWSPTSPSPASWPAGAGPWPCSRSSPPTTASSTTAGGSSAWSDPRHSYEQPGASRGDARP